MYLSLSLTSKRTVSGLTVLKIRGSQISKNLLESLTSTKSHSSINEVVKSIVKQCALMHLSDVFNNVFQKCLNVLPSFLLSLQKKKMYKSVSMLKHEIWSDLVCVLGPWLLILGSRTSCVNPF